MRHFACTCVLYTVYYFTIFGKYIPICKLYATPETVGNMLEMKLIKFYIYLNIKEYILVTPCVFKK